MDKKALMNKRALGTVTIVLLILLAAGVTIYISTHGIISAVSCFLFPEYKNQWEICDKGTADAPGFEDSDTKNMLIPPSALAMKFAIEQSVLNKDSGVVKPGTFGTIQVMCSKPIMELGAKKDSAAETLANLLFACYTTADQNPDIQSIQNKGGKHTCYEVNTSQLTGEIAVADIKKYLDLNEGAVDLRGGSIWNPTQGGPKWELNVNREGLKNEPISSKTEFVRICTGRVLTHKGYETRAYISSKFASEKYSNGANVCPPLTDVENQYQCTITNFVLPQAKPAKPSEWIGGFGDPQYLLYSEKFEPHAEEYWRFDIDWKPIVASVAVAGFFSYIPGVGSKMSAVFGKGAKAATKEAAKEAAQAILEKEALAAEKKITSKATARAAVQGFMKKEGAFATAGKLLKRFFVKGAEDNSEEAAKLSVKGLKQLEIIGENNPALKKALVADAVRAEEKLLVEGVEAVAAIASRSSVVTAKESTKEVFARVIAKETTSTAAAENLERRFVQEIGGSVFASSPQKAKAMARSIIEEESLIIGSPIKAMVDARARDLMNKAGKTELSEFIPQAKEELITGAENAVENTLKQGSNGVSGNFKQQLTAMRPSVSTTAVEALEANMIKDIGRSSTAKEIDDFAVKLVNQPTQAITEGINGKIAKGLAEPEAKAELAKELADALKKGFGITDAAPAAGEAAQEALDPAKLNKFAFFIVQQAHDFNERTTRAIGTAAGASQRSKIEKVAGNTARLGTIAMLAGSALDHLHDVKYTTHGANTLVFHQLATSSSDPELMYDLNPAVQDYMVTNAFDYENPNARFYAVSPCSAYVVVKTSRCSCDRMNEDYRYRVGDKPVNGYPVPDSISIGGNTRKDWEEAQIKAAGLSTEMMVSNTEEGRKAAAEYQQQVAEALRPPSMFNIDPSTVIEKETVASLLPEEKDKLKYYLYTGGLDPEKGYTTEVNYDYLESYIDFSHAIKECPADNWMADLQRFTDTKEYIQGNEKLSERLLNAYDGARYADTSDGNANVAEYWYYKNIVKVESEVPSKLQFDCVQVMMYPEDGSYCYMGFNEKVAAATASLNTMEAASSVAVAVAAAFIAAPTGGASILVSMKFVGAINLGFEITRQYIQNFGIPGWAEPTKWPNGHHGED